MDEETKGVGSSDKSPEFVRIMKREAKRVGVKDLLGIIRGGSI